MPTRSIDTSIFCGKSPLYFFCKETDSGIDPCCALFNFKCLHYQKEEQCWRTVLPLHHTLDLKKALFIYISSLSRGSQLGQCYLMRHQDGGLELICNNPVTLTGHKGFDHFVEAPRRERKCGRETAREGAENRAFYIYTLNRMHYEDLQTCLAIRI